MEINQIWWHNNKKRKWISPEIHICSLKLSASPLQLFPFKTERSKRNLAPWNVSTERIRKSLEMVWQLGVVYFVVGSHGALWMFTDGVSSTETLGHRGPAQGWWVPGQSHSPSLLHLEESQCDDGIGGIPADRSPVLLWAPELQSLSRTNYRLNVTPTAILSFQATNQKLCLVPAGCRQRHPAVL